MGYIISKSILKCQKSGKQEIKNHIKISVISDSEKDNKNVVKNNPKNNFYILEAVVMVLISFISFGACRNFKITKWTSIEIL